MVTAPAAGGPSARRVEARRRAGDSHRAGRRRTVRTSRRGETWSGDTWEVIVGIGRDVTAGGCPQASCAAGGPEVADPDGALLASWSPDTDWVDPPADVPSPEAAIDVDTDGTGAFAVMADGSVLVRAADRRGGHAPRPPVPAGPSPVPAVDRSSSVVAGCVTHESGDRGVTTTCDIGQAR
jgi:hypothetical protein